MEPQRLMLDYPLIELEPTLFETLLRPRVATVKDRHIVFLGQCIDGIEQRQEVLLRIDVLFAVSREQHVFPFLQSQPFVDIRGFDFFQVCMQDLGHWGSRHVSSLLREPAFSQITSCMLRIGQIHIGDDIHNTAVRLLRQAFILAPVAGLHVEDRDMQTLGGNG